MPLTLHSTHICQRSNAMKLLEQVRHPSGWFACP
jgi:hypothetical protein